MVYNPCVQHTIDEDHWDEVTQQMNQLIIPCFLHALPKSSIIVHALPLQPTASHSLSLQAARKNNSSAKNNTSSADYQDLFQFLFYDISKFKVRSCSTSS